MNPTHVGRLPFGRRLHLTDSTGRSACSQALIQVHPIEQTRLEFDGLWCGTCLAFLDVYLKANPPPPGPRLARHLIEWITSFKALATETSLRLRGERFPPRKPRRVPFVQRPPLSSRGIKRFGRPRCTREAEPTPFLLRFRRKEIFPAGAPYARNFPAPRSRPPLKRQRVERRPCALAGRRHGHSL